MLREKLGIPADEARLPVMIGAGLNKNYEHPDDLKSYCLGADAVVFGSVTKLPREANEGDSLQANGDCFSLNSWGMQNQGVDVVEHTGAPHSNLIASIAGFSVGEYIELYNRLWNWGLGIEANFGCPNTGAGKRIFSFDLEAMEAVLSHIQRWNSKRSGDELNQLVGVKLSPISDPWQLAATAGMLAKFEGTLGYVATCNTFPNGKAYDQKGRSLIRCATTKNRGGIGGRALAPISLGQASQFVEHFDGLGVDIEVVRVGGLKYGSDLRDSELEGIAGVQVVTAAEGRPNQAYSMQAEYVQLVQT